jgi:hypothetical protein
MYRMDYSRSLINSPTPSRKSPNVSLTGDEVAVAFDRSDSFPFAVSTDESTRFEDSLD